MPEKPIIFSTQMVQAILEGRKSQTRRIAKDKKLDLFTDRKLQTGFSTFTPKGMVSVRGYFNDPLKEIGFGESFIKSDYGQPGDVLYVRESHYRYGHWIKEGMTKTGKQKWKFIPATDLHSCRFMDNPPETIEKTTYRKIGWYKRPGIFLPKELTRIFLKVENVRVERLDEISWVDAICEGVDCKPDRNLPLYRNYTEKEMITEGLLHNCLTDPRLSFQSLWDIINGSRAPWASNPWVWVIEFSRRE